MARPPTQQAHTLHHAEPRITANELARFMVTSDAGRIGIIRRARESVTPQRTRYADARRAIRSYLASPTRDGAIITAARNMLEQRANDPSRTDFVQNDATLSVDALDSFMRLQRQNQFGGIDFVTAPQRQPTLTISDVAVSVNVDVLIHRDYRNVEQIGGALFRFTRADEETEYAADRRRRMGIYAATLVQMHIAENLAGNRLPIHQLCLSVDVQCEEMHAAPRNYAARRQNLESACLTIAALWDRV